MLFRSLDGPLANILQGGLQEKITVGGDTGEKVGALDVEVSAKDGGETVEGTENQRNRVGRENNLGTGKEAGS